MKSRTDPATDCPCGTGLALACCCGRYHVGAAAPDAESLMRSRYSAWVRADRDYLLRTWHPRTRPQTLDFDPATRWLGLSVRHHRVTGPDHAEVEFIARYRVGGGSAVRLCERSRFVREAGHWYYLDGETG